ncbi:hypothetical protein DPMN_193922 [Dreissena polymorpha]|uniref:Uncharacterized protein n=1 Tax=Dreissena polymorpha TaxID=45954 RepID=A0A9D3Y3W2_DREPO|nr:hypothetical protein DPMN_193922 [Dreissena polymorpha]
MYVSTFVQLLQIQTGVAISGMALPLRTLDQWTRCFNITYTSSARVTSEENVSPIKELKARTLSHRARGHTVIEDEKDVPTDEEDISRELSGPGFRWISPPLRRRNASN